MKCAARYITVVIFLGLSALCAAANFAIFQVATTPPVVPDVICNVVTGVATGVGAGTCASPAAVCDGVANDTPGFVAFRTWAVSTWQASHSGLIELYIPPGSVCHFTTQDPAYGATVYPVLGIHRVVVVGYGATITDDLGTTLGVYFGGFGVAFCNPCAPNPGGSVRLETVTAGGSTVTLKAGEDITLFQADAWIVIGGIDTQGSGDPPNPGLFEFKKIQSVNSGAMTVTFTEPLENTYRSTWPIYNPGDGFHSDQGGPATLWTLDPSWDMEVEWKGLTISYGGGQSWGNARSLTLTDITTTGSGVIPTQNKNFLAVNYINTGNAIHEIDKLVDTVVYRNSSVRQFYFQNGGVKSFTMDNTIATQNLNGTPTDLIIQNGSVVNNISLGASAYGVSRSVTCDNSTITTTIDTGGFTAGVPVNKTFAMSGGVISTGPTVVNSIALSQAKGSSGNLTINGSAASGGTATFSVEVSPAARVAADNTGLIVTVTGTDFNGSSISDTASFVNSDQRKVGTQANFKTITQVSVNQAVVGNVSIGNDTFAPLPWAVPGANFIWVGSGGGYFLVSQITSLTQPAGSTAVATSEAGGFPSLVPIGIAPINDMVIRTHPAPRVNFTNCGGGADAIDLSQAGAHNRPYGEYTKRPYDGSVQNLSPFIFTMGNVNSIVIDVTRAYTGVAAGTLSVTDFVPNARTSAGVVASYNPVVNLKVAGRREITPVGVTCDGVAGACSGDSGLTMGDTLWFAGQTAGMTLSANIAAECQPVTSVCPTFTIEIDTNQGVVFPP